jgi:hypothetical protein
MIDRVHQPRRRVIAANRRLPNIHWTNAGKRSSGKSGTF